MLILQNQDIVVNTLLIICAAISLGGIINILLEEYIYSERSLRRQRKSKQYKKLHLTENRVKQRINKE